MPYAYALCLCLMPMQGEQVARVLAIAQPERVTMLTHKQKVLTDVLVSGATVRTCAHGTSTAKLQGSSAPQTQGRS